MDHAVFYCDYHLVWPTKYRRKVLNEGVREFLVGWVKELEEIKQLIDSLVDNAAKFSKEGGTVQVNLFKRFNKVVLTVSDQGVGISEQKLPSLLKPFVRGTESMQYNYEGIGLGLYTSKVILDKLGGTIAIRSKLGTGTTVTITLPAKDITGEVATVMITPEQTSAA